MASRPSSKLIEWMSAAGWRSRIPPPYGPHSVKHFHFRIPGENGVFTQIFFPINLVDQPKIKVTENGQQMQTDPSLAERIYRRRFQRTPKLLFDILAGNLPGSEEVLSTPILDNTKIQGGPRSLPWILFSHGLIGNCEVYSKTCTDLAANGFVVVALEHEDGSGAFVRSVSGDAVRYRLPPWGLAYNRENVTQFRAPFLSKRQREISRVVEFLTNEKGEMDFYKEKHLDIYHCMRSIHPDKAFIAGHSFGAATAVHMTRTWIGRFKGTILMDLWPYPIPEIERGITGVAVCSVLSEQFARRKEGILIRELLNHSTDVRHSWYAPGTFHIAFSDMPWWASTWTAMKLLNPALPIADPNAVQKALNQVYVGFASELIGNQRVSVEIDQQMLVPFR